MGDSFFGFNTRLPPTGDDEGFHQSQKERAAREDADVYDFASLRDELGGADEEVNDGLGDQLDEVGDDLNDETFGDDNIGFGREIGQDFDFAANTVKFTANLSEEERILRHRNQPVETSQADGRDWNIHSDMHGDRQMLMAHSTQFDESSAKSIWGSFGNNESFGTMNQGNVSPFAHHHQLNHPTSLPGLSPSNSMGMLPTRQHRSLEEIEAEMQRAKYRQAYGDEIPAGKKMLSLAEVEAAMMQGAGGRDQVLQQQQQQQHLQQLRQQQEAGLSAFGFGQPDPAQIMALRQQQELMEQLSVERELKRQETMRKSQYDNLMTQNDKDFIQRIQLTQLASGDPYADDFYYQVYSSLRLRATGANNPTSNGSRGRGRREDNMMHRMQQQLQRIVNNAKRRPKQTQGALEGTLGKITSLSSRNPRQSLQVSDKKANLSDDTGPVTPEQASSHGHAHLATGKHTTLNDRRRVLTIVEGLYLKVLELEQMRRQGPSRSRRDDEEEQERKAEEWNEQYNTKVQKLWNALKVMEGGKDDSTPLLTSLLGINKGKKLIPRIVRPLSHDQNLTMLSVIIANFSQLQVCQHVIYPGTQPAEEAQHQRFVPYEDVELFMNAAAPSLLGFITEAPMQVVIGLTRLFMEKNDIRLVAQTKPGLAFLTMLLSRAEILKQGGGALNGFAPPSPEDFSLWQDIYNKLFNFLQGYYSSIFPSLYYLVPTNPSVDMAQLFLSIDDMYIWQFLAAIAVGASMDQQHVLVTEVRDRVMENIILAKSNRIPLDRATHRIDNTNLFLHSLGLDASQVTVPL